VAAQPYHLERLSGSIQSMSNLAAWLPGVGKPLEIGPAELPHPGPNEIVVENKAVALQPADWKLQHGILPIPLSYPAILGMSIAGYVHEIGENVTRFKKGDRVLSISAMALVNDSKYGAHQRYTLSSEALTAQLPDGVGFEDAITTATVYAPLSALFIHLDLEKWFKDSQPAPKRNEKILVWGGASSLGQYAIQFAVRAGYEVVATASERNITLTTSLGASKTLSRTSSTLTEDLIALGPYFKVFAAADAAADQPIIGSVLAAQGGGKFLSTMGVRPGVVLPETVSGYFVQYLDDYLKPENAEFVDWVFGDGGVIESGLREGWLKTVEADVIGGLGAVQRGLDRLKKGGVSARKLVVRPDLD